MGWTSPTGYTESAWTDEQLTYDNDTATYASYEVAKGSWSIYLVLTFSQINCDKVQIWSSGQTSDIDQIEVDYYDTSWTNFYSGSLIQGQYIEYSIGSEVSITSIRIRYYNSKANASRFAYCHEVQLNEVGAQQYEKNIGGNLNIAGNSKDKGIFTIKLGALPTIPDYYEKGRKNI